MRQKWTIITGHLHNKPLLVSLLLLIIFIFVLLVLFTSEPASANPPFSIITSTAPQVINESSEPTGIFNITIWDSDSPTLHSINVTVQNLSSFNPDTDLAPLKSDETSGLMMYQEANGQAGFQVDDAQLSIAPTQWVVGGPGRWTTSFDAIDLVLSPDLNCFYVVIRTSPFISDNEMFIMGIMQGDITTDHGNLPSGGDALSSPIDIDTQDPSLDVFVTAPGSILRIGDWVNITAQAGDTDISTVSVDLSDFNGLSPYESMNYDIGSGTWYYNLTNILPGNVDTGPSGYPFTVTVMDQAKNTGVGTNASIPVDIIIPSCTLIVSQQQTPASIGSWINISVLTDSDVVSVEGDLSAFTGLGAHEPFTGKGSTWWLNFTVSSGTLDGMAPIIVAAIDDVGYLGANEIDQAQVDETSPSLVIVVTQAASPAGVDDWVNITVNTDSDVVSVEGDFASFGITGQSDSEPFVQINGTLWYFNFTIAPGSTDASAPIPITIRAYDDAMNLNMGTAALLVDEVYPKPLGVYLMREPGRLGQFRIGDFINITIDMGAHADIAYMMIDAPGLFSSEPVTDRAGSIWYLNTTLSAGSVDEEVTFSVSVLDDGGNLATAQNSTHIDLISPALAAIESVSDGITATPESVFGGLLTINARCDSTDISRVSFYDGEPWGAGLWLGDDHDFPYAIVWPTAQDDDGNHDLYVRVYDDAGNFLDSQAFFITVDNFDDQPVPALKWYNRAGAVNLTLALSGDVQNSVKWELFRDSLQYLSGTMTKSENPVDTQHQEILMELDSEYEIALTYLAQAGSNSIALTFEIKNLVYTLFYTFDSQETASHIITIKVAEVLQAMGVVTLDGTGSLDPDGTITDYRWYVESQFAGSGRQLTLFFSENREHEVALQVASDDNQTNQTITTLVVENYKRDGERSDILSNEAAANYLKRIDSKALLFESETSNFIVSDPQGNLMGEIQGNFVNQIPGSRTLFMLGATRIFAIPNQLDLRCEITGLASRAYHLGVLKPQDGYSELLMFLSPLNQSEKDVYRFAGDMGTFGVYTQGQEMTYSLALVNRSASSERTFNLTDIRLVSGGNHIYEVVDWAALDSVRGAVKLNIDSDGDGATDCALDPENGWTGLDVQNAISIKQGKSPGGIPLAFILVLGFVAALGAGGMVFLLTEIGKVTFFYFFYVAYTRIKREYVLDNFTRGEIFGYIKANPGVHFSEIKRALELKNGSLAYHIRTLEKQELVVSKHDRGYKRFYPKAMKLPERNIRELIPVQRSIMQIVKEHPGISQTSIAERLDISFQLVHYHVKILRESGYLVLEKDGKQTYWYDKETYKGENT